MKQVFICEDNTRQRDQLETTIGNYIMLEELDMEITLSTGNPLDILNFLKENPKTLGLYFLGVDLNHEMNGIILASQIRNLNYSSKIVFITMRTEMSYLTFTHKIEALDFIDKSKVEDVSKRVQECLQISFERYSRAQQSNVYAVKVNGRVLAIPHEEIILIETASVPHKLILHQKNKKLEYYGSLNTISKEIPDFYRCHNSFVINPSNIKVLDKSKKHVRMINEKICPISSRKMKGLINLIEKIQE